MADKRPIQVFYEGTALKITTVLSEATADTCTITIDDPSENVIVDAASMTKEADYVYSYVYQSSTSNDEGDWVITIKAVLGDYTSVTQRRFTLNEQD